MKKKLLAVMMWGMMLTLLAGCGKKDAGSTEAGMESDVETGMETDVETDAKELLGKVWETYEEAELFPIGGGNYDNTVSDAPGRYDITKTEDMDAVLGLPKEEAALIDDAASMVHMMNANTFTAGAFHLKDAQDQQKLADSLKENIVNRQWICGFPDTLIIVSVGNEYIISAFGNAENIETFKTKIQAQYPMSEVMYEESLL